MAFAALAALVLAVVPADPSAALAAGDLDPTFGGGDGIALTDVPPPAGFSRAWEGGRSVLVRPDGKLVVFGQLILGRLDGTEDREGLLLRYRPDGTLDESFGPDDGGVVTFDWDDAGADGSADTEQHRAAAYYDGGTPADPSDDRIVVVGYSAGTNSAEEVATGVDFRLSIFDEDGRLLHDALPADFNAGADYVHGVALQCLERDEAGGCAAANTRIVVVGRSEYLAASTDARQSDWAIARYHLDATPDTCFGPPPDSLLDMSFVVTCANGAGTGTGRLLTDFGERDQAFTPVIDRARAVEVQPGLPGDPDRLVVAGEAFGDDWAVAAYLPDGNLDSNFGPNHNGKLVFSFTTGSSDWVLGLTVDGQGRVLVAGYSTINPPPNSFTFGRDLALARLTPEGLLDPAFRERDPAFPDLGDGRVSRDLGEVADDIVGDVVVDGQGRLVLGGRSRRLNGDGTDSRWLSLARFLTDGSMDTGFGGGDGIALTSHAFSISANTNDFPMGFALLPDGVPVLTGGNRANLANPAGPVFVARFLAEGTTAPETTITAGPASPTNDPAPIFFFSADQAAASFQCQVDGTGWATCKSGEPLGALADGAHTFEVRATNPYGDVDPTPATASFTVDTVAPDTTITSGPSGTTTDTTPTFAFSSSEEDSSFECKVDTAAFTPCTSPHTTAALSSGTHTFQVQATDAAGNTDASPASRTFSVDASSLRISDRKAKEGHRGSKTFSFTVSLSVASTKTVTVSYATADGTAKAPGDYAAVTSGTLTFSPGQTSKTIAISVKGDRNKEPHETFFVNLSAPTNATIADGQGQGTILNDD